MASNKEKYHLRNSKKIHFFQEIKCYTIDLDLQIMEDPMLDQNRYYDYLRFLNASERKYIQKFKNKYGNDAVLRFKQNTNGGRKISLKEIIRLQDLTKEIKQEEDEIEEQDNQNQNEQMEIENIDYRDTQEEEEQIRVQQIQMHKKKIKPLIIAPIDYSELIDQHQQNSQGSESIKDLFFNELSIFFQKPIEQLDQFFYQLSYDYKDLVSYLQGQVKESYLWDDFEDEILKNKAKHNFEYRLIVRYKGWERVQKRFKILQQNL